MPTVIGLTLVKLNGVFHLVVRNASWDVKRVVNQDVTGGGVEISVGDEVPSGSFDEVIPREKGLDWRTLSGFRLDIYDKETQRVIVFSTSDCEWNSVAGRNDQGQARTNKVIGWAGRKVNKL